MKEKFRNYIRFDWAAKRILRDKANFSVLEGLVSVLLGETVTIKEILESESNTEQPDSKFNRVDIMAKNSKDQLIIVEIQLSKGIHTGDEFTLNEHECYQLGMRTPEEVFPEYYLIRVTEFNQVATTQSPRVI